MTLPPTSGMPVAGQIPPPDLHRLLVANLPSSAVMVFDHDLRFVLAAGPELVRNGTSQAALEGRSLFEAVDPQFASLVEPNLRAALGGRRFRAELPFGDSMYAYTYEPLFGDDGRVIYALVFAQDVTPLWDARRRALENEARMRELVGSLPAIVFNVGADRRIRFVGGAAVVRLGVSVGALVGQTIDDVFREDPVTLDPVVRALRGERVHADVPFHGLIWETRCSPVLAADGGVGEVIGVAVDVTDQRRAEEMDRQRQKLEAIGRLAGGVAHDFNNMLMIVRGNAEMMLRRLDASNPLRESLEQIQQAAEQSVRLTRQMLAFARQQVTQPRIVDLNETIPETLHMLRRVIGEDIALRFTPGEGVAPVRIDLTQLSQVLTNLCLNARDAIVGVGVIHVTTRSAAVDPAESVDRHVPLQGRFSVIVVTDNGAGMDAATLEHVFEPFFTTKSVGEGTGLGLATVFGIAKQHGGFVTAASTPGLGSTFQVYLPEQVASSPDSAGRRAERLPRAIHETVLLVEDEPAVLSLGRSMLEALGYQVLTAGSPAEALALVEAHDGPIDLLVTDVVMPGMNGRELADRLLGLRPGLPVLFVSGYSQAVTLQRGVDSEGPGFLQKPFSLHELAARVREALDGQSAL